MNMNSIVQTLVTWLAVAILVAAGAWFITRGGRIAQIDRELSLGYATDRFGEPNDPSKPDSGEVWRAEQVSRDNKITLAFSIGAASALLWIVGRSLRQSADDIQNIKHPNRLHADQTNA